MQSENLDDCNMQVDARIIADDMPALYVSRREGERTIKRFLPVDFAVDDVRVNRCVCMWIREDTC